MATKNHAVRPRRRVLRPVTLINGKGQATRAYIAVSLAHKNGKQNPATVSPPQKMKQTVEQEFGPKWDEFRRVVEQVQRETAGKPLVPLNDPAHPPTIQEAAGAFADDPNWDRFMEAVQEYRREQTRLDLERMGITE